MSASAKKKPAEKKAAGPKFIFMICAAISAIQQYRGGASRAALASYIIKNYGKTAGARFNAALRRAFKTGIEAGVIKQGDTAPRYR
eukprot:UN08638